MKNVVVFTGAGISAESGLGTFRDEGGLWDKYCIEDVATPNAFKNNPELVLEFYNIRRRQLLNSKPNDAHFALNKIKKKFNLFVITQNIDDLHERSGTKNTLHLHGKIMESRSTIDNQIYPINGSDLNIGDTLRVKDIKPMNGIEILSNPESTIISVLAPRLVVEASTTDADESSESVSDENSEQEKNTEG